MSRLRWMTNCKKKSKKKLTQERMRGEYVYFAFEAAGAAAATAAAAPAPGIAPNPSLGKAASFGGSVANLLVPFVVAWLVVVAAAMLALEPSS